MINFPSNPALNDEVTLAGVTYRFNGTMWRAISDPADILNFPYEDATITALGNVTGATTLATTATNRVFTATQTGNVTWTFSGFTAGKRTLAEFNYTMGGTLYTNTWPAGWTGEGGTSPTFVINKTYTLLLRSLNGGTTGEIYVCREV